METVRPEVESENIRLVKAREELIERFGSEDLLHELIECFCFYADERRFKTSEEIQIARSLNRFLRSLVENPDVNNFRTYLKSFDMKDYIGFQNRYRAPDKLVALVNQFSDPTGKKLADIKKSKREQIGSSKEKAEAFAQAIKLANSLQILMTVSLDAQQLFGFKVIKELDNRFFAYNHSTDSPVELNISPRDEEELL